MNCEFQDDFSFRDTGYVPINVSLTIGPNEHRNKRFETGFEIQLSDFNYNDILTPFAFAAVVAEAADGILNDVSGEYTNGKEAISHIPEFAEDWIPPHTK